jgi:hypothetical protein
MSDEEQVMEGPDMRYLGEEPVTGLSQVVRYLTENYTYANGKPVTEADAKAACETHRSKIDQAINLFRSNVYYPGDQIGSAMGWAEREEAGEDE